MLFWESVRTACRGALALTRCRTGEKWVAPSFVGADPQNLVGFLFGFPFKPFQPGVPKKDTPNSSSRGSRCLLWVLLPLGLVALLRYMFPQPRSLRRDVRLNDSRMGDGRLPAVPKRHSDILGFNGGVHFARSKFSTFGRGSEDSPGLVGLRCFLESFGKI